jgi:hypothetical protein
MEGGRPHPSFRACVIFPAWGQSSIVLPGGFEISIQC